MLDAVNDRFGLGLQTTERTIGLAALEAEGTTLPADIIDAAKDADGVILGPVSTHEYPPPEQGGINPSATIRKQLDLYANIRPSRNRSGVPALAKNMDLVIVRENTEGFYADRAMYSGSGEFMPTEDMAMSLRKITAQGSRRIARAAFDLARTRKNRVTMVHKANVLKVTDGFFRDQVQKVAADYPDVTLDEMLVDAMAAMLVRDPGRYDVVLTTNMFGDILSDEASELAGGLGLAPSVNAGDEHAVAQAVHGSAPDIAGRGIANPTALILSTAMLLDWIGGRDGRDDLRQAAAAMERAMDGVLADPANHTPDLGGTAGTSDVGAAAAQAIIDQA